MDVVQVEGTTLREEDYDAEDWTTIIGTYRGKSQSKARKQDLPEASEKQKAPEERTETLTASARRPTYRPNPAELRATQQVTRRSRQMAPLLQHAIKVIFRSQGDLFMPNIQRQLLLRCLCATAKIPVDTEVEIRVHPTNNTCTVATTNQETALNVVKIRSITLNAKAYVIAAYIAPAAETVRGVISNAFWDETIIYYGGGHLCTPYKARPEACTNCRAPGHRYDVCPEQKKPRCPRCGEDHGEDRSRHCVPRCILCGGEHLTGTGWCKAKQRQITTKPPARREPTGRQQLHEEGFPRWHPSAPQKTPEELTRAERVTSKPDPRDEELARLREEVRGLRQATTQPSHPPPGHPSLIGSQSLPATESPTPTPPVKKKRKGVPPSSEETAELEQSGKTAELEAKFEANLRQN
ncbi:hypothetical protein HPB52_011948 [Rhipicephalus sanguineus]|uniref:Uncharacterized protein n=1 Tax=Rhipicephalus sanguineus TaxID=34632 RepID=A0A9D4SP26_RHISA|nr:hypothetical protein HPB52_011948 [Rhipicephalus sanguineus]